MSCTEMSCPQHGEANRAGATFPRMSETPAGEHSADCGLPARCDEHYAQHPSKPHLVAVCTLPPGHDGKHSNVLPKAGASGGTPTRVFSSAETAEGSSDE